MPTVNRDKMRSRQITLAGKLTDACCQTFLLWDWTACGDEWGNEWSAVWDLYRYFEQYAEIRDYQVTFPGGRPTPLAGHTVSFSQSARNRSATVDGEFRIEVAGEVSSTIETTVTEGATLGAKATFKAGALFASAETEFSLELNLERSETTSQSVRSEVRSSISAFLKPGQSATAQMEVQFFKYPQTMAEVTAWVGKKVGAPDFEFARPEWWKQHSGDVISDLPARAQKLKWYVNIEGNLAGSGTAVLT